MFARTQRLTLRPGWIEDAPELAHAIGHEAVVRNLARAPWPYALGDAQAFLKTPRDAADLPVFLVCALDGGASRIVGCIGLERTEPDAVDLGYWITPDAWGRGYATEAGRAVIDIARALRLPTLSAGHFTDNPASGRVLRKLGFRATGRIVPRHSAGRGGEVQCVEYEQALAESDCTDPCDRMAA
ncbi:GNAT family N-acetyltransferase [Sphingomonas sp. LT1P40]|uniref:GNAT family N-acetyltransferase n=1 Tax=Alteristakelama amylovorans TaxID=3096166 RepID=UPI002FC913A0